MLRWFTEREQAELPEPCRGWRRCCRSVGALFVIGGALTPHTVAFRCQSKELGRGLWSPGPVCACFRCGCDQCSTCHWAQEMIWVSEFRLVAQSGLQAGGVLWCVGRRLIVALGFWEGDIEAASGWYWRCCGSFHSLYWLGVKVKASSRWAFSYVLSIGSSKENITAVHWWCGSRKGLTWPTP